MMVYLMFEVLCLISFVSLTEKNSAQAGSTKCKEWLDI